LQPAVREADGRKKEERFDWTVTVDWPDEVSSPEVLSFVAKWRAPARDFTAARIAID